MKVKIFITGGTLDKEYNELTAKLYYRDTRISEMLARGRSRLDVDVETLMLKDSLDITENERNSIVEQCQKEPLEKIVITHGTDTMVETAKMLGNTHLKKTIVLTGSMIPNTFGNSDALFNLGSALAFVQVLPEGVYIAMNGKKFDWNNVKKNKEAGRFEELS